MSRCFCIVNETKNTTIKEGVVCWEDNNWCSLYSVMHKFKWHRNDKIYTICNEIQYDEISTRFEYHRVSRIHDPIIKYFYDKKTNEMEGTYIYCENIRPGLSEYTFTMTDNEIDLTKDHIPIWIGNKCIECMYRYTDP